jgi:hypothetical protein
MKNITSKLYNSYKVYLDYIKNTGGSPLITYFDNDFEPIGSSLRRDMILHNLVEEKDGRIYLKE